MKEKYWQENTILDINREMYRMIEDSVKIKPLGNPYKNSALLVLDAQRYFLDEESHSFIPSAAGVLPGLRLLIDKFIEMKHPVIFTRHLNTDEDAGQMASWWKDLIREENPISEISSDIIIEGSPVIRKTQYDAFYETGLDVILREKKIEQVIITGFMTHLCCETTARSAFVHGYKVIFPVDGTATYNRKFHLATLRNLAHGFAMISTVSDILGADE
ncbi:MAG: isochorismatase family protein [Acidobacteria bacterium]|nr:isochorismatase family protein [Acidobacteriota bacterium]